MTEIVLSKRMKAIADMVRERSAADIGCDHAFVSVYLVEKGICDRVVAMDLRKGPLSIATKNVSARGLESVIDTRLSDGFEALKQGEAECAIIAGMGGLLMIDILKRGHVHTDAGIALVLQPQSDIDMVREYILSIGYRIDAESMVADEGKRYTVIRAIKGGCISLDKVQLMFGPCLLEAGDEELKAYLLHCKDKNEELTEKLMKEKTSKGMARIKELKAEAELIKEALCRYY